MPTIRVTVIDLRKLSDLFEQAMSDLDGLILLGECIDKLGQPASVEDFVAGVRADQKLPEELKELVMDNMFHFYAHGWWFVSKESASPLAGQMVRVTKLEGEGDDLMACVLSVSARNDDADLSPKVSAKELSGKRPA